MSSFSLTPSMTVMRRMFYAVTPNETSFETIEEVPEIVNEAIPFFWVFLLTECVISMLRKDGKIRINDGLTSICAGVFSKLPLFLMGNITLETYSWVYRHYCIRELPWDSAWTWWLTFLGVDFAYYWFHRLAHEVNFLWATHQTHHSSEEYNLTTALRQSVLQGYASPAFYLPMALFVPPQVFLVHVELNLIYQFWIHTRYIKSLGPLEYILNTPSHHRVHHGRNPYCIDKNHGGTLIIWDRMFGTFEPEREEVVYGLIRPLNTFEAFSAQFGYCNHVVKKLSGLRGLGNKVSSVFCGPGWAPGSPRTGEPGRIPEVEKPVRVYNVKLSGWMTVYVTVHFILFLAAFQHLLQQRKELPLIGSLMSFAYGLFNLSSFGRLLDKSRYYHYYELLRLSLFMVADIAMCQLEVYGEKGYRPPFMYGLQAWFAFSIAIWLVRLTTGKKGKDD